MEAGRKTNQFELVYKPNGEKYYVVVQISHGKRWSSFIESSVGMINLETVFIETEEEWSEFLREGIYKNLIEYWS